MAKPASPKRSTPRRAPPDDAQGSSAIEMVLIPSGFTWADAKESDFQLAGRQGAGTDTREAVDAGSGRRIPVFNLVPRSSYEGRLPLEDALPSAEEQRTRPYGGHDLVLSGSMVDANQCPPAFTLTAEDEQRKRANRSRTKRRK